MIEHFQLASRVQFADNSRMFQIDVVVIPGLHEDWAIAQADQRYVAAVVNQLYACNKTSQGYRNEDQTDYHTFPNMLPSLLDRRIPIHVRKQAEANAIVPFGRIGEAVNNHCLGYDSKQFSNATVQFVVGDGAPILRLVKILN